jgi:hypothetical protein
MKKLVWGTELQENTSFSINLEWNSEDFLPYTAIPVRIPYAYMYGTVRYSTVRQIGEPYVSHLKWNHLGAVKLQARSSISASIRCIFSPSASQQSLTSNVWPFNSSKNTHGSIFSSIDFSISFAAKTQCFSKQGTSVKGNDSLIPKLSGLIHI